jgi:hypothetical protein
MKGTTHKVTVIKYVEGWRFTQINEVHTEDLGEPYNEWAAKQAMRNGFEVVVQSDIAPESCIIKFTSDSGQVIYAIAKVEEIAQPIKGQGIELVADYGRMFSMFHRDATIYAQTLRHAPIGHTPTKREEDMHAFITRINVLAGCMTTTEEIAQLREVLDMCAKNLNHAQTIMDGDEDLEETRERNFYPRR